MDGCCGWLAQGGIRADRWRTWLAESSLLREAGSKKFPPNILPQARVPSRTEERKERNHHTEYVCSVWERASVVGAFL